MVLLGQFRRDVKSHYKLEKPMAHRKQIKVKLDSKITKLIKIKICKLIVITITCLKQKKQI